MKAAQNLIAAALGCALVWTTAQAQQPSAARTSPAAVESGAQQAFGVLSDAGLPDAPDDSSLAQAVRYGL
jgi:hypothetical protein